MAGSRPPADPRNLPAAFFPSRRALTSASVRHARRPRPHAHADPPKVPVTRESLREAFRLFRYLGPYRARLVGALLALLVSTVLGLAFPYLMGRMIDAAQHAGDFTRYALLALGALSVQSVITFFQSYSFNQAGQRALTAIRKDTYARLITLPMGFFAQRRVGELASRLSADLTQIEEMLTTSVPQFSRQLTILLGSLCLIATLSGRLLGVMLASLPPIMLVALVFGRRLRGVSRRAQDRLAESGVVVEETLQGIANVKAFTNEPYEVARYGSSLDAFLDIILRTTRLRAAFVAFIIFAVFGVIVGVTWYGCRLLQSGALSAGQMISFSLYTVFVGGAMGSFADLWGQIQKTVGATARVRELLGEDAEDVATPAVAVASAGINGAANGNPTTATPRRLRGAVEFADVRFRYPSRPEVEVLRGLSLTAEPGQRIALVGPSGAGKSTVVSLLLRFYEPDAGQLRLDGRPAGEFPLRDLRAAMAVVPQEVLLFGGSIGENIAYGRPGASPAEIERAAREANAHDFIAGFPEGYATLVGERGVKLSGGQRQRLAIARAILKDPAILILDEATSALDSESERLVQDALERLLPGRTSFTIAHRLSTVRAADRIYVLENGAVAESGTHGELVARENGVYRRLSEFQFDPAPAGVGGGGNGAPSFS